MYNLICADLYKLRKALAMKILFLIMLFAAIGMSIIAYLVGKGQLSSSMTGIGFLLSDVHMISLIGAAAAGMFICGDFDNRTIHDAIANGYSRGEILYSKALVFLLASMFLLLPYFAATLIAIGTGANFSMDSASLGFLHLITANVSLASSSIGKLIVLMLTLLIVYAAQLSICIPMALGFKRPVVVIIFYYAFTLLSAQLGSLKASSKSLGDIFSLTPYEWGYSLINLNTSSSYILQDILVSLIFIFVMLAVTYFIFRKSEIK